MTSERSGGDLTRAEAERIAVLGAVAELLGDGFDRDPISAAEKAMWACGGTPHTFGSGWHSLRYTAGEKAYNIARQFNIVWRLQPLDSSELVMLATEMNPTGEIAARLLAMRSVAS